MLSWEERKEAGRKEGKRKQRGRDDCDDNGSNGGDCVDEMIVI